VQQRLGEPAQRDLGGVGARDRVGVRPRGWPRPGHLALEKTKDVFAQSDDGGVKSARIFAIPEPGHRVRDDGARGFEGREALTGGVGAH